MFQGNVEIIITLSGTKIIEGIEFNAFPPPSTLIKAMEKQWAEKLIKNGTVRLNSLEFYQNLENDELGDSTEGLGELKSKGHPYNVSSVNKIFVWCGALPDASFPTLLSLDTKYDTVIRVVNPLEFTKRIELALIDKDYSFAHPHIGSINYSRSDEVDMKSVQSQFFHWNVFQKRKKYTHQNEYRLAFTDTSFTLENDEPIDLEIGSCLDLVQLIKT